ncbi:MAG: 50S rRNA methyltransferase [Chloroflexi bacterium]|nr:50S rRNA methyltransferase [Chloroflexota bacterium]
MRSIVTCNPDFEDLALSEVRRASPLCSVCGKLAAGVLLLNAPFESLAAAWRAQPPIFVRHVCPAHKEVLLPSTGDAERLLVLLRAACAEAILPSLKPAEPFSVQTRIFAGDLPLKSFDVNCALAELVTDAPLAIRQPRQVISVAIGRLNTTLSAWLGLSSAADNLSDWAGGARRFAREQGCISRSEFKLLEALEVFGVALPPRGCALDLGAAPGGWTRVLRERGMYVTAVDPAALDPRLLSDSGVRYRRLTAESYLRIASEPFDLIVNDMRMDARDSARLMCAYARLLKPPDGMAIMTLKLPETKRGAVLKSALSILASSYQIVRARQLFHNRSEITLQLRRR